MAVLALPRSHSRRSRARPGPWVQIRCGGVAEFFPNVGRVIYPVVAPRPASPQI